jgi:hypothetical protein
MLRTHVQAKNAPPSRFLPLDGGVRVGVIRETF